MKAELNNVLEQVKRARDHEAMVGVAKSHPENLRDLIFDRVSAARNRFVGLIICALVMAVLSFMLYHQMGIVESWRKMHLSVYNEDGIVRLDNPEIAQAITDAIPEASKKMTADAVQNEKDKMVELRKQLVEAKDAEVFALGEKHKLELQTLQTKVEEAEAEKKKLVEEAAGAKDVAEKEKQVLQTTLEETKKKVGTLETGLAEAKTAEAQVRALKDKAEESGKVAPSERILWESLTTGVTIDEKGFAILKLVRDPVSGMAGVVLEPTSGTGKVKVVVE